MWKPELGKKRLAYSLILLLGLVTIAAFLGYRYWRNPNVRKQRYYNSAVNYYGKGKYREAAIQFLNAIKMDPQYTNAHYHLAQCYAKLGMWGGAYAELDRVVNQDHGIGKPKSIWGTFSSPPGSRNKPKTSKTCLGGGSAEREAHTLLANAMAAGGTRRARWMKCRQPSGSPPTWQVPTSTWHCCN